MVTYQVLGRKQPWKRKLLKFPTRCPVSNFNSLMQISPCLQKVALLLKPHHHLCKIDRIIDKKVYQPNILFKYTIHLLLVARNSRFSCVHGQTHATFADTSHDLMATGWSKLEPLCEQNCQNIEISAVSNNFSKANSAFKNNIYRNVAFTQVL